MNKKQTHYTNYSEVSVIKKCHCCGSLMESASEIEKCVECGKSFLPLNYFSKVHAKNSKDFKKLFTKATELHEDDMILGLNALW